MKKTGSILLLVVMLTIAGGVMLMMFLVTTLAAAALRRPGAQPAVTRDDLSPQEISQLPLWLGSSS